MTPLRSTLALLLLVATMLLVAGCVGEQTTENRAVNETATVITPAAIATTIPVPKGPDGLYCFTKDNRTFTITSGDSFSYTGISPNHNATVVNVWIFGKEYADISNLPVKPDGSFNFTLRDDQIKKMNPGTYRIIFQYPRDGDAFDIRTKSEYRLDVNDMQGNLLFNINNIGEKENDGLKAANILEREIMKPGIRDTISNITLISEEPWIQISPIGDHIIGDNFSINGTTNLEAGKGIRIGMYSSVCNCAPPSGQIDKTRENPLVFEHNAIVTSGSCRENLWAVTVNTSKFLANEYIVFASTENEDVTGNSLFNVFEVPASTAPGNPLPNATTNRTLP